MIHPTYCQCAFAVALLDDEDDFCWRCGRPLDPEDTDE